jgi:hypothetical protein
MKVEGKSTTMSSQLNFFKLDIESKLTTRKDLLLYKTLGGKNELGKKYEKACDNNSSSYFFFQNRAGFVCSSSCE